MNYGVEYHLDTTNISHVETRKAHSNAHETKNLNILKQ